LEGEFGRLLCVVLDRMGARFFEVTAYDTQELPSLRADSTRQAVPQRQGRHMWGEHTYNNRIRTEKQRHYDGPRAGSSSASTAAPAHGIVIAAPAPGGRRRPFLHNYRSSGHRTARLNRRK